MWFNKYMTKYQLRDENDGEGNDLGGGTAEGLADDLNPDAEAFEALAEEMIEDGEIDDFSIESKSEPVVEPDEAAEETANEDELAEADKSQKQAAEEEPQKPSAEEESQSAAEEEESAEAEEAPQETETPTLEQYTEARNKTIDEVEKMYAFTDEEDINKLRTNPEEVLPRLAAEMFYDIHQAVMQSVTGMFPQMLDRFNTQAAAQQAAEESFYAQWPVLQDAKYKADYERIGSMYKQLNPTATQEQFNMEVGAQMMISNKIPFNTQTGAIIEEEVVEETPVHHAPARPSASSPAPAKPQENEFEEFSREFDND